MEGRGLYRTLAALTKQWIEFQQIEFCTLTLALHLCKLSHACNKNIISNILICVQWLFKKISIYYNTFFLAMVFRYIKIIYLEDILIIKSADFFL